MTKKKTIRFLEFFVVGLLMGVVEDLIAINLSTGEKITLDVIMVAFFVALPFAIFSELIVDHPDFWHGFSKKKSKRKHNL